MKKLLNMKKSYIMEILNYKYEKNTFYNSIFISWRN